MSLTINGKNIELSENTYDYIEKKTQKFNRFLPHIEETRVDVYSEKTKSTNDRISVEITVRANRKILRSEERSSDLHAALDIAVDKLNRQIVRLKGKQLNRRQAHESIRNQELPPLTDEIIDALTEENARQIVKVKQFSIAPMNEEEAVEQLQLLDHDFFIFYNADLGRINVLYKRADDNYGLLDPVVA